MGTGEESTPTKTSKPNSSAQETPATPSYPDWSSSMQAYYSAGTPPFFATTIASPTAHTYLWGSQHALIHPFGTPVPYPALYPPGGVFAHPNVVTAPSMGQTIVELEGKVPNGRGQTANKKSKGTTGDTCYIGGKGRENGKATSGSGNDGATQSAESGSEGSSDATDESDHQEYAATASKKGSFNRMLADGANAQNNTTGPNLQAIMPGNPVVSIPATNLNMGMDLWSASASGAGAVKMRPNPTGGHEGIDERELKKQKRKQSNRESARRSRLRKQTECEELQARVESLTNDNRTLHEELVKLSAECEKITSENDSIKEKLAKLCGVCVVSEL